jgi:hypothetical protein
MHGRRHGEAGKTLQGAPPERERANRLWIAANQAATPDVKILDRLVTRVAREIRLLEQSLKATNARTTVDAYDQDDAVLGELT